MFWMCNDMMWADGEGMGQLLYLLGVVPRWLGNGMVEGFDVIPLEELGRPRIDVTVRVSGLLRNSFPAAMHMLDAAVQAVAALDEPLESNFVRKHTQERLAAIEADDPDAWRSATFRIFSSEPGTYQAGVNLAVYASAWQTEADLADIFLHWNGYAYGKDAFRGQTPEGAGGQPLHSRCYLQQGGQRRARSVQLLRLLWDARRHDGRGVALPGRAG